MESNYHTFACTCTTLSEFPTQTSKRGGGGHSMCIYVPMSIVMLGNRKVKETLRKRIDKKVQME